ERNDPAARYGAPIAVSSAERSNNLLNRSHILNLAAALVLASSAGAQTQTPSGAGQTSPPGGAPTGAPPTSAPGPGAGAQDQPSMDPYMADKDFVKSASESTATEAHLGKLAQDKA